MSVQTGHRKTISDGEDVMSQEHLTECGAMLTWLWKCRLGMVSSSSMVRSSRDIHSRWGRAKERRPSNRKWTYRHRAGSMPQWAIWDIVWAPLHFLTTGAKRPELLLELRQKAATFATQKMRAKPLSRSLLELRKILPQSSITPQGSGRP